MKKGPCFPICSESSVKEAYDVLLNEQLFKLAK